MSGQTRSASVPVVVLVLRPVRAHERVHERDAHLLGRRDHVAEVADHLRAVGRIGMERVGVIAEARDRQALRCDLVGELDRLGRPTGSRRRCGSCRRSVGSARSPRGQQAISMLSKPLAAVQSTTSTSGVAGNGAVRRPSLIAWPPSTGPLGCTPGSLIDATAGHGGRRTDDVHPATEPGALGDRVADQHLVVAVGERGVRRPLGRSTRRRRRRRSPGRAHRTCRRTLRRGRRAGPPPPVRPLPIRAGLRSRISFGRSR